MAKRPNISIVETADGSYSLNLAHSEELAERMHHSQGAFTESLYIYNEALKKGLSLLKDTPPQILSVGLGLGYNELISLCELHKQEITEFYLESYESEAWLSLQLQQWLMGNPSELESCYSPLLRLLSKEFSLPENKVKNMAKEALEAQKWVLKPGLPLKPNSTKSFNIIFYDMFSRKMNPDYWTEPYLEGFLKEYAGFPCVISTYAATGALKRALNSSNFELLKKSGFSGKRDSTLAMR